MFRSEVPKIMSSISFRAWDGNTMIYDIGVNREGVALRRVTPESDQGIIAYVPEPTWIVSRWSGLTDRNGERIFGHDVLELGSRKDTKSYGAVLYDNGRFVVWFPNRPTSAVNETLNKYCSPTFVHMVKVVGTVFDMAWDRIFTGFPDPTAQQYGWPERPPRGEPSGDLS